jgi:hypothetical protein
MIRGKSGVNGRGKSGVNGRGRSGVNGKGKSGVNGRGESGKSVIPLTLCNVFDVDLSGLGNINKQLESYDLFL